MIIIIIIIIIHTYYLGCITLHSIAEWPHEYETIITLLATYFRVKKVQMFGYSELTVICISKQGAALVAGKLGKE